MVLAAILDGPYPDTGQVGMRGCHQGARWGCEVPPRRAMAHRGATKARIGVGAVQNRRTGLGGHRDVCGDAGQPAHQRHATPRCARPRDAPLRTRLRHHDASIPTPIPTHAPKPRPARPHDAPIPTPTPTNATKPPLRDAPRCADSHPDDPTKTVDSHPDALRTRLTMHK
jgi:hypothetical protein